MLFQSLPTSWTLTIFPLHKTQGEKKLPHACGYKDLHTQIFCFFCPSVYSRNNPQACVSRGRLKNNFWSASTFLGYHPFLRVGMFFYWCPIYTNDDYLTITFLTSLPTTTIYRPCCKGISLWPACRCSLRTSPLGMIIRASCATGLSTITLLPVA